MNDRNDRNSSSSVDSHLGPNKSQTGPDYDPVNLMAQVFEEIGIFMGPAQDILLSWLLRLPGSIPQAEAAGLVLKNIIEGNKGGATPEALQLIELMEQVANHNMDRVQTKGLNKRRGGHGGRVRG